MVHAHWDLLVSEKGNQMSWMRTVIQPAPSHLDFEAGIVTRAAILLPDAEWKTVCGRLAAAIIKTSVKKILSRLAEKTVNASGGALRPTRSFFWRMIPTGIITMPWTTSWRSARDLDPTFSWLWRIRFPAGRVAAKNSSSILVTWASSTNSTPLWQ